jgi:diguanylate cyclase (GGDEF)-like protein
MSAQAAAGRGRADGPFATGAGAATSPAQVNSDRQLARVLVEFAKTLGTDFPVQKILDRLVLRVLDVVPVTGAGVMLMGDGDELHFVAASDDRIQQIQVLQNELAEGPCLQAYRTSRPVAVPDLSVDDRFPRFSPRALGAGLAAVFTFPMRLDERRLGALDLYRDTPGELDEADLQAAQVLADVAAAYLFNASSRAEASDRVAALQHRSLHDPLTGLPNRTLFAELVEHAVAAARRSRLSSAVLFVDLDRFKTVNDRFGHHVGDLLLRDVAVRLGQALRPGDSLARLAGDEFVVLCENLTAPAQGELVAQRITAALAEPFDVEGHQLAMTASVGIALTSPGEEPPEALLRDADFAMYQAKNAGGGQHRVVDRTARLAAERRTDLEADLRDALRLEQFELHYQPIARTVDNLPVAVEALLRWQHADRGQVSPQVIIAAAERTGLILPLGEWVLHQACSDFVRWRNAYPNAPEQLAVNVSVHQLMGPAFAVSVAHVLRDTAMDPQSLVLEVTESVFLDDADRASAVMSSIKALGVKLALDDFGTGYSSLSYLSRFPFDILKIDGHFVADLIGYQHNARAIVKCIIGLGRALGLTVIAEGVETAQQLTEVAALGAQLAQGYHLSRPLAVIDLERTLIV